MCLRRGDVRAAVRACVLGELLPSAPPPAISFSRPARPARRLEGPTDRLLRLATERAQRFEAGRSGRAHAFRDPVVVARCLYAAGHPIEASRQWLGKAVDAAIAEERQREWTWLQTDIVGAARLTGRLDDLVRALAGAPVDTLRSAEGALATILRAYAMGETDFPVPIARLKRRFGFPQYARLVRAAVDGYRVAFARSLSSLVKQTERPGVERGTGPPYDLLVTGLVADLGEGAIAVPEGARPFIWSELAAAAPPR